MNFFQLKKSNEKPKVKCEKISVVTREPNPGPLALATGTLTTELRQTTTSKIYIYTVQ